jgi:hypothetical protein
MLRYINGAFVQGPESGPDLEVKSFILLHFDQLLQRGFKMLVHCTKFRLTGGIGLPRMKLLRRTNTAAVAACSTGS